MNNKDLLYSYECGKELNLRPQICTELGIESDETFKIKAIKEGFELVEICNQYNITHTINPKYIISYKQ